MAFWTNIDEGGDAPQRFSGPKLPPRDPILAAIESNLEVSIVDDELSHGLCLFPRVDGVREWFVRAYVAGGAAIAAFDPSRTGMRGTMYVREGGVRVNHPVAWSMPGVLAKAITRRFLGGTLTVEDAARYAWSFEGPHGPDTSVHRIVRLRALYRKRAAT